VHAELVESVRPTTWNTYDARRTPGATPADMTRLLEAYEAPCFGPRAFASIWRMAPMW
jgi:hypothetical protein